MVEESLLVNLVQKVLRGEVSDGEEVEPVSWSGT